MASPFPPCPTCEGPLLPERIVDDVRESRHIAIKFHAFLAGTRFKVLGVRRGLLRVAPLDPVPDVYDIPPLCASWELVGKLDE